MIRISTRGRYALRAMIDVTEHGGSEPVLRQEIAARQGISADYVAQLCRRLEAAGLLEGLKGPGGGYRLTRGAASITAGDVIRAAEGPIAVVHCVLPATEDEPACKRLDRCVTHLLWTRLSQAMNEVLDSVTLQELADQAAQLPAAESHDTRGGLGSIGTPP